jgi:hypothetical protein
MAVPYSSVGVRYPALTPGIAIAYGGRVRHRSITSIIATGVVFSSAINRTYIGSCFFVLLTAF